MDQELYHEDLMELIENALAPLEKYFTSFIDLGYEDREPRKIFIDDVGQTGLALTQHAQDEIRAAMSQLFEKIGRVTVRRAGADNRLGVPPRKVLDVDLSGSEASSGRGWAKQ